MIGGFQPHINRSDEASHALRSCNLRTIHAVMPISNMNITYTFGGLRFGFRTPRRLSTHLSLARPSIGSRVHYADAYSCYKYTHDERHPKSQLQSIGPSPSNLFDNLCLTEENYFHCPTIVIANHSVCDVNRTIMFRLIVSHQFRMFSCRFFALGCLVFDNGSGW